MQLHSGSALVSPEPNTIFIDESGDHNLQKIDPQYPVFGLCGVLMRTDHHAVAAARVSSWKTAFFGQDVVLHTREINRNLGVFSSLKNQSVRTRFWTELCAIVDELEFTIIAGVIDKQRHVGSYSLKAEDPYHLTLTFLLERFVRELKARKTRAGVIAEHRNAILDTSLQAHFRMLMANGTSFVSAADFAASLHPVLVLQPKHPDAIGMQIADLIVGPVCRESIQKTNSSCLNNKHRFRKSSNGAIDGYGLKIFP